MNAIENIKTRNSHSKLIEPFPSKAEMKIVYESAMRAPDHANLKPSNFIEVTGKGLLKLSKVFENFVLDSKNEHNISKIEKFKNSPFRAPMIIILICDVKNHPKVPAVEQMMSTAAAAQNMLLALHALNYSAIWRTGIFALNDDIIKYFKLKLNQKILGYLYVGTATGKQKRIPDINIENHLTKWD